MERRTFVTLISGGLLGAPRAAAAQRAARVPLIGAMKDIQIASIGRCSDDHAKKFSGRAECGWAEAAA